MTIPTHNHDNGPARTGPRKVQFITPVVGEKIFYYKFSNHHVSLPQRRLGMPPC